MALRYREIWTEFSYIYSLEDANLGLVYAGEG